MKNKFLLLVLVLTSFGMNLLAQKATKPNVLFIAIDDLKPIMGCYGNKLIKTPNIDRLARMGTVFGSNYCQQAVCGPTRASIMTGMRPDYTKIWDLKTKMRDMNPNIVTIPQYFISQGYATSGVGKIYHPSCVDKQNDKPSWTVPYFKAKASDYANGEPVQKHYQSPELKAKELAAATDIKDKAAKKGKEKDEDEDGKGQRGPASEGLDLPDNAYEDGVDALIAKKQLIAFSKSKQPYFMAVGFKKPHLPFVSPKKYWDLYKREDMPLAEFQEQAKNSQAFAYESSGELKNYSDIPGAVTIKDQLNRIGLPKDKQQELIHAYYAAISYTDAQVGILLNTLDSLGTLNNTVIVLWGDHGWHLGDHDMWGKHTNFEQSTRAPLIFAAPNMKGGQTCNSLTEFVDVFPTLCELSGVPVPVNLNGKSLKPLMQDTKATVKTFSMSQYPRKLKKATKSDAVKADPELGKLMGYSMRTDKYRYTVWLNRDFRATKDAFSADRIYTIELYDYVNDPLEKVNYATDKKYAAISKDLQAQMEGYFKSQLAAVKTP
jgi:iduronate 2-sulfatase